jgi:fumarylpyruvate hydrolase
MTFYVIDPPTVPSVAVAGGSARFPVRRIFCVGRNYAAHTREMGFEPEREPPFFFSKPADAVIDSGRVMAYSRDTTELHHEIELVAAIGREAIDVSAADALSHVWGYAAGIDFTRRDHQFRARDSGRPWDLGKGFDESAPCGPLRPAKPGEDPAAGRIWLSVNGVVKQDGDLSEMIWKLPEIIAILSHSFELKPGDLIYSGTPAGIGPVKPGDVIAGGVEGYGDLSLTIGPAK